MREHAGTATVQHRGVAVVLVVAVLYLVLHLVLPARDRGGVPSVPLLAERGGTLSGAVEQWHVPLQPRG